MICQPITTKDNVLQAHDLIVLFCTTFEQLYGKEKCTPNMHMACHLKDIIFDYGSIWCFSFERYNGVLEGMKKSWVCPEKQLLLKFLDLQLVCSRNTSKAYASSDNFEALIHAEVKNLRHFENLSGSLCQMVSEGIDILEQAKTLTGRVSCIDVQEKAFHQVGQPLYDKCFMGIEIDWLTHMYNVIYPNGDITHISRFYKQFKSLVVNGEEFISLSSRSQRSSAIIAHWATVIGRIDTMGCGNPRVGLIKYFIRHTIKLKVDSADKKIDSLLARVKWFEEHPRRNYFYQSVVVCGKLFSGDSYATFIPVSRIMGRCTITQTSFLFDYGEDNITLAIPCIKNKLLNIE